MIRKQKRGGPSFHGIWHKKIHNQKIHWTTPGERQGAGSPAACPAADPCHHPDGGGAAVLCFGVPARGGHLEHGTQGNVRPAGDRGLGSGTDPGLSGSDPGFGQAVHRLPVPGSSAGCAGCTGCCHDPGRRRHRPGEQEADGDDPRSLCPGHRHEGRRPDRFAAGCTAGDGLRPHGRPGDPGAGHLHLSDVPDRFHPGRSLLRGGGKTRPEGERCLQRCRGIP